MSDDREKTAVRSFWDRESAGEFWALGEDAAARFQAEQTARYRFEPYLAPFAQFDDGAGRDVLEIGVGMGADHLRWAESGPASLAGIDLSPRAITYTVHRLSLADHQSTLTIGDAEQLPHKESSFDIVYSWGVLHHSPDTEAAIAEVHRVLRPGGVARIMIYHRYSLTAYMLWLRYGLFAGKGLRDTISRYLESPGTKAYTIAEARELFSAFEPVDVRVQLNYGDLLQSEVGRRHRGPALSLAKALWPRWLLRRVARNHGLYLLIEARKAPVR